MIPRYTAEEWSARAYTVRHVMSSPAYALSVPLVAWISSTQGEFGPMTIGVW